MLHIAGCQSVFVQHIPAIMLSRRSPDMPAALRAAISVAVTSAAF